MTTPQTDGAAEVGDTVLPDRSLSLLRDYFEQGFAALFGVERLEAWQSRRQLDADRRRRSGIKRISKSSVSTALVEQLEELYRTKRGAFVAFAVSELGDRPAAEDAVNTTFGRVQKAQPKLDDAEKLPSYVWTALRNEIRNRQRSLVADRKNTVRDGESELELIGDRPGGGDPDNLVLLMDLHKALTQISDRQREAVVCVYYYRLTVRETAARMGITDGAVKSYCSAGRDRLRSLLPGYF